MRTIKFRAWDNEGKKMCTSAYGTFHLVSLDLGETSSFHWTNSEYPEPKFDLEMMQYTGLKDSNGKEVFESDILSYVIYAEYSHTGTVKFGEYDYGEGADKYYNVGWYVQRGVGSTIPLIEVLGKNSLESFSEPKVIGNVHQNPELL